MKNYIKKYFVEIISIIIVFFNLFNTIIPPIPLIFFLICLSLYRTSIVEAYFLSATSLPILLGSTLSVFGISGVATLIELLLFGLCVIQWVINKRMFFYNFSRAFTSLLTVLLLFCISALLTSGGNYAFSKLLSTVQCGVLVFFACGFLLSNPNKCDYIKVGLYLILYSFLMLLLSPTLNNGVGPEGLFDFGYLRQQNMFVLDEGKLIIEYQHVGFFATVGCAVILLERITSKTYNLFLVLCFFLCSIASLYSGARQFVVISLSLLLLWVITNGKTNKSLSGLLYVIVGITFVALVFSDLFEEGGMLNSVRTEGYLVASRRESILLKGITDFMDNPIFGVGFGRFEFNSRYGLYPHNLLVEILCELGIVGFVILLFILFKPIKYLLKNQVSCMYLFIVFLFRSMVSGGLDSNIMLFSYIFAVLCLKVFPTSHNEILRKKSVKFRL